MKRSSLRKALIALVIASSVGGIACWVARPEIATWMAGRARAALAKHQPHLARKWLGRARRVYPANAEAELLCARCCRELKDFPGMRDCLQRAKRLGAAGGRIHREQLLAMAVVGNLKPVEPYFSTLLDQEAEARTEAFAAIVEGCLSSWRNVDFVQFTDLWKAEFPNDARLHYLLGRYELGTRRLKAADESFRRAVEIDPEFDTAWIAYGRMLLLSKDAKRALDCFERCTARSEARREALLGVADSLKMLADPVGAKRVIQQILQEFPDDKDAELALGKAEYELREYENAVRHLEAHVRREPNNVQARQTLTHALVAAGRKNEAQRHIEFLKEWQNVQSRIEKLRDIILEEPENLEARFELGSIHLKYGPQEMGVRWLTSILGYDPDHAAARKLLEQHFRNAGAGKKETEFL